MTDNAVQPPTPVSDAIEHAVRGKLARHDRRLARQGCLVHGVRQPSRRAARSGRLSCAGRCVPRELPRPALSARGAGQRPRPPAAPHPHAWIHTESIRSTPVLELLRSRHALRPRTRHARARDGDCAPSRPLRSNTSSPTRRRSRRADAWLEAALSQSGRRARRRARGAWRAPHHEALGRSDSRSRAASRLTRSWACCAPICTSSRASMTPDRTAPRRRERPAAHESGSPTCSMRLGSWLLSVEYVHDSAGRQHLASPPAAQGAPDAHREALLGDAR